MSGAGPRQNGAAYNLGIIARLSWTQYATVVQTHTGVVVESPGWLMFLGLFIEISNILKHENVEIWVDTTDKWWLVDD